MTFRDAELRYRPGETGWLASTDSRSRLESSIVYDLRVAMRNPHRANTAAPALVDGKGRKRLVLQGTADRAAKLSLLDAGGKVVRDLLATGGFIVEEHAKRNKRIRPWKEEERRSRARKCSRAIGALWPLLDRLQTAVSAAWRLVLLTAQRPGEVLSMRWRGLEQGPRWRRSGPPWRSRNGRRLTWRAPWHIDTRRI
jgi:integrase